MRRLIIVVLMLGGMQLILPLGASGHGGQWLLIFGFLIVAAEAVGGLSASIRLPKIVGFLLAGLLFGPSFLNVVDAESIAQLAPVSSLAIALIAFLAGAELRWSELKERGVLILKILSVEMSLTFVAVTGLLVAVREYVPFLHDTTFPVALVLSMMFASVAVVHSPAVTMALLTETKARGPVARTTLGVVLVSDVAVILLFSAALALARAVAPPASASATGTSLGLLFWEIFGALVVGAALGGVVAVYLRWVRRELFLFAVLIAFFGAELARVVHVETLLMLLTAGFVSENLSELERGEALRIAMERSAAPVFVVFFALAGASMEVTQILVLWPLLLPLILVRLLALWVGTNIGARWGGASPEERRYVWLGLVSQAGVAIGLATIVANLYPERGADIRTLFLATLAVNQTVGPIMFRHALSRSGELSDAGTAEDGEATDEMEGDTGESPTAGAGAATPLPPHPA
ncbi:MAG: cation:proton antiporter [Gemmatimonadaceae bacterium]|nr:cation:proton antiporter [Gemmatimonadaceae bacterium]